MSVTAFDDGGLVWGYQLGPARMLDAATLKAQAIAEPESPLWLHFNLADVRARRWLEEESGLGSTIVEALLEPEPRVHVQHLGTGLCAVLADLHHDFDRNPEGIGQLRIFVDGRRMISFRRHRLRTVDQVRRELASGTLAPRSVGELFAVFLDRLATTFGDVVTKLGDKVDDAEDEILAGRYQTQGKVLGSVRRNLARPRRHLNANRAALAPLRGHLPDMLEADPSDVRQAVERMDTISQDMELVQERTRLLQEEIAGRQGEATNRNLFLLSTVTAALLPITLITGIFGMNVGGLPGVNHPPGFRWVMLSILVTVAVALALLRRRRE
jgi:zinc transporter